MTEVALAPLAARSLRPVMLLAGATFCIGASLRITDPLLPQVAATFGVPTGSASIIATAFLLPYGLFQVVYGPLGDRIGKYVVIALAMVVSTIATAAGAAAPSLGALALARAAAGISTAAVIPLTLAYVGDVVAYEERQPTLARILSGQLLGVVFGQAVGGMLIQLVSWRAVFGVLSAAFAVVGAVLWLELASGRVVHVPPAARTGPAALARQSVALVRAPRSRAVLLAIGGEGLLFFSALAYLGAYLRHAFALDYAWVGLLLGGFGAGGLGYSLFARRIVRRLGEPGMLRAGGVLMAAGLAALLATPWAGGAAPAMLAIGFGLYMFHNTLQTRATQMAPEARGAAVSLFTFFFFVGQAAGVPTLGLGIDRLGFAPVLAAVAALLLALGLWAGRRG